MSDRHDQERDDIFRRLDRLAIDQKAFAELIGMSADKLSKVRSGTRRFQAIEADDARKELDRLEREGRSPARPLVPDHLPTRTIDAGETAAVMRMDLSFALGPGTNIDEHYIEGEPIEFDISFLRQLTPSPPDRLRVVDGIGDSMGETIRDRDQLILDLNQRVLNMQDRIWAMSLFGAGAVKRLKAIGQGRVLVISDNPDVPDQEVDANDIALVGRVVGSIRRH